MDKLCSTEVIKLKPTATPSSRFVLEPYSFMESLGVNSGYEHTPMNKQQFQSLIAQSGNIVISEEKFATFLDLCFNVYCFYLDVGGFSTIKPIMIPLACTRFLKNYISTKSVLTFVRLMFEEIGIRYDLDFDDEVVHFDADNLEAQGFLATARKTLNTWDSISHAELAIKFQTVVKCLLSCTLTQQLSMDFMPERILEYANNAKLGVTACTTTPLKMIQSLLDFILTFVESGYEFFQTGDMQSFLVADRAVRDFVKDWEKLEIELTGSVVNLQARPSLYLDRLDNVIARGNALLSVSNFIIRPLIKTAMDHRIRFLKQVNISCFRKPPFSVLLHGPPGIGKSSLIQTLGTLYHRVVTTMPLDGAVDKTPIYPDLTWDPMFNTHTKNPYDDFWSGYRGASQWLVILDDLAREKARHVEAGLGLTIVELLSIVNSIGITSNQAALEDKGAVPIIPKMVIATSNTKGLHAVHAGSCPEAILRRLPYVIEPRVKPAYWDSALGRMKEMKHVEDAWTFKVETYYMYVDSQGKTRGDYRLYKPDPLRESDECSMAELQAFLCKKILSHERSTQSMMDGLVIDPKVTICEHGVLSNFNCTDCFFAQSKSRNKDNPDFVDDVADYKERQEKSLDTSDYVEESDLESQGFREVAGGLGKLAARPVVRVMNELVFRPTAVVMRKLGISLDPALYISILPNFPDIGDTMSPEMINYIMSVGELLPTRVFDQILLYLMKSGRNRQLVYFAIQKYYSVRIPKKVAIALDLMLTFTMTYGACRIVTILFDRLLLATGFRKEQAEAQANIWKSSENNDGFMIPNTTSKNNDSEIENTVMRSSYELAVRERGATDAQRQYCFQLIENWQCTVGHAFPIGTGPWQCIASLGAKYGNMRPSQGFTLVEEDVRRLPNDIIIFRSSNLLPRRSLFRYLPKKVDRAGRPFRVSEGVSGDFGSGLTTRFGPLSYTTSQGLVKGDFMDGVRDDRSPKKGDCGSLIISKSSRGSYISGMHVAGSPVAANPRIIITQLSQDIFKDYIGQEPTYLEASSNPRYVRGSPGSGPLCAPHPTKGVHHWAVNSNGVVLGSYKGRVQPTSRVTESIICTQVEESFGVKNPFHKPIMSGIEEDGQWKNPFTIATQQQGSLPCDFTQVDVDACADSYLDHLLADNSWLANVEPISIRQAVNGIHGEDYIDILNMSTSGGFYFPGAKNKYFEEFLDENGQTYYMPNEAVMQMIDDIESKYLLGERYDILFNGTLKDEPVSAKKRASGATRVFTACDVAFSIIVRRQYLSLTAAIQNNNILTECAVGMNVYSLSWDELYKFVTQHGENRIIAGDFETFDKRMSAIIISTVFRVLDTLRSQFKPLTARDVMISKGIKTDISFPITNMNGDLIQFFGGNSSGHPLTIIVNSVANSIYMRFAYLKTGHELSTFRGNVALSVMGDDNIMGSKLDSYNHTTISQALKRVGINYTMADKDAESKPFCHITEVDFCKRSFVLLDGRCIAPLAEKSILKSLCMYVEKGNISHEEQLAQSYLAARREWSLHGREVFVRNTSRMTTILGHHPEVERFFIDKHGWPYQRTLEWTLGLLE